MTTQAEKDAALAALDHALADIATTHQIVADWPVDGGGVTPPVIVSFTAQPNVLPAGGGSVVLTWATEHALLVEITANGVKSDHPANASAEFTIAQNTTFVLEAFADEPGDNSATATVTVKVLPPTQVGSPQIMSFTAEPGGLPPGGGEVTLAWATEGATIVIIGETQVDLSGSAPLMVTSSCRLTLKAIGPVHPIATAFVDVTVQGAAQTGEWMPSVGASMESAQLNFSPRGDYYRNDQLPGRIPFTHFDDPDYGIICRSANGQVLQKRRVNISGDTGLYVPQPVVQDGKILQRVDQSATDDMRWLAAHIRETKPKVGRRGEGFPGPYCTWHSHPNAITKGSWNAPLFMGPRVDGLFLGLLPTGDTQPLLQTTTIEAVHDFTLTDDPQRLFLTGAYEGKIVELRRSALNITSEKAYVTGMTFPTSCRWTPKRDSPRLIVCDQLANIVWIVNPATATKEILTDKIASPFWTFDTSDPDIVVVLSSADGGVFPVNLSSGAVGANMFPHHQPFSFGTICVDTEGTFGPVDCMLMSVTHSELGGTNNALFHWNSTSKAWDFSPFHAPNTDPNVPGTYLPPGGVGRNTEYAHYLWYGEYHRVQSVVIVGGYSDLAPTLYRSKLPNDPPEDYFEPVGNDPGGPNRHYANLGMQCMIYGGPASVPAGKYPSATCIINTSGSGVYNADWFGDGCPDREPDGGSIYVADMNERNKRRRDFIYNGFGGIHRRPEFVDDPMATWAIGYKLLINSQEWLRRGTACTDEWRASFPATMPDTALPPIPDYNSYFLQVYVDSSGMYVFQQDRYSARAPIPSGTEIKIYADYGSPWEKELATVIGDGTTTLHAGPLNLPPGRYVMSAVADGHVCKATLTDI